MYQPTTSNTLARTGENRIDQVSDSVYREIAHAYGFRLEHQTLHYLELARRFPNELSSPYWVDYLGHQTHAVDQRLAFAEQQLFGLNKDV